MFRSVMLIVLALLLLAVPVPSMSIAAGPICSLMACQKLECENQVLGEGDCCHVCQEPTATEDTAKCKGIACPPIRCSSQPVRLPDECCDSCPVADTIESGVNPDICKTVKCSQMSCLNPVIGECCDTCLSVAEDPEPLPIESCPVCAVPDCPESDLIYNGEGCSCPICPRVADIPQPMPVEIKPDPTEPKPDPTEPKPVATEPQIMPVEIQPVGIEPQPMPIEIEPQPKPAESKFRAGLKKLRHRLQRQQQRQVGNQECRRC